MSKNYDIICFGEILWDIFPDDKKVLGGAPLNVAMRANSFGLKSGIISRVGKDEMATKAFDFLQRREMDSDLIQKDNDWATGYVNISIDDSGSAKYDIKKPAAWDYIKLTEKNIEAVDIATVFLYGSLAIRSEVSKKTLQRLIKRSRYRVFDVNLREPYYDYESLEELMQAANFIKLNDEELEEISNYLKIETNDINKAMIELGVKTRTETLCVTKGSNGAILLFGGEFYEHSGFSVQVEDTVGAGDSFLATLVTELIIQEKEPEDALKNACAIGAIVVSKKGANPIIGISDIMSINAPE